ncbi:reverse transcriptase domain-containing protein [Tanacetum coccineum]
MRRHATPLKVMTRRYESDRQITGNRTMRLLAVLRLLIIYAVSIVDGSTNSSVDGLNTCLCTIFYGFEKEDPHAHIRWFNKITSTIKYKDVPNSSIRLMLFPFSLEGAARIWLKKEPPHSILTWEDLVSKFINQFFPPSKTTNLQNEITNFQQRFDESFYEAWERFKDLLRACPHHGFTELHQLDTFYIALTATDQDSLNAAVGGNLLTKTPRDALTIIENKSKVRNLQNKPVVIKVSTNAPTSSSTPHFPKIAALADAVKALVL